MTENIMIPSSSSSVWNDCISAMSPLPKQMFRTPGNDASTIHAAEQRLNIQFSDSVKSMMQYCSGANLPCPLSGKLHPLVNLWSVEYWQNLEDSTYGDSMDSLLEDKEKYRRILIGNDPFGADYGRMVLLRIPSSDHSVAAVEVVTMNIPEFIEFESLESWIRSSLTLSFDEYIQEWSTYIYEGIDSGGFIHDDTLDQQEKQPQMMSYVNEEVREKCEWTRDTCAEAAWTRHSKEWEATVAPAIFNCLSNFED